MQSLEEHLHLDLKIMILATRIHTKLNIVNYQIIFQANYPLIQPRISDMIYKVTRAAFQFQLQLH